MLDLIDFMQSAMGIQVPPGPDPSHPIPQDANTGMNPGGYGRPTAASSSSATTASTMPSSIGMSGMQLVTDTGTATVNMPFSTVQKRPAKAP